MVTESELIDLAKKYLDVPIFYVVPDASWALGLEWILPQYHIICVDDTDVVDYLKRDGFSVFCAETDTDATLVTRSASGLLKLAAVERFIQDKAAGREPHLLIFKPSPAIAKICTERGYRLLANSAELNRSYEDKLRFGETLDMLGIRQPTHRILPVAELDYDNLSAMWSKQFVLQKARGFAGSSSWLIRSAADLAAFRQQEPQGRVKLSKWITGIPVTLNACVLDTGVLQGRYFYQITGHREFNRYDLGTCGNDYAYPFNFGPEIESQIAHVTQTIGKQMRTAGYRGIFGLDLIVSGDARVYVIENNARLVASIPVFTKLQLQARQLPLLLLHLLQFAGASFAPELKKLQGELSQIFEGSQLILRNTTDEPLQLHQPWHTGVYDLGLQWQQSGWHIGMLGAEQLLLNIVKQNRWVNPNMEYANMQFATGIVQKNGDLKPALLPAVKAICYKPSV